jgi:hypothetical protein
MATNTLPLHAMGSAQSLAVVVKSDSTVVGCRALYVGGTGDVAILAVGDTAAVTLSSVPAGALLPIACQKIMSTNTTATNMVAFF